MTRIRFFPGLSPSILLRASLLAVFLASCAPAETPANPTAAAAQPLPATSAPTLAPATEPPAAEATALPVATSRGPELHATDPSTVSLASGGLQFVEFFRFT